MSYARVTFDIKAVTGRFDVPRGGVKLELSEEELLALISDHIRDIANEVDIQVDYFDDDEKESDNG